VRLLARWLRGLARFVVDFLVGDTPELFLAVVGLLVVLGVASKGLGAHAVAAVLLPLGVVGAVVGSVLRALRRSR
jgi:hypothetical protein